MTGKTILGWRIRILGQRKMENRILLEKTSQFSRRLFRTKNYKFNSVDMTVQVMTLVGSPWIEENVIECAKLQGVRINYRTPGDLFLHVHIEEVDKTPEKLFCKTNVYLVDIYVVAVTLAEEVRNQFRNLSINYSYMYVTWHKE